MLGLERVLGQTTRKSARLIVRMFTQRDQAKGHAKVMQRSCKQMPRPEQAHPGLAFCQDSIVCLDILAHAPRNFKYATSQPLLSHAQSSSRSGSFENNA